MEEDKKIDMALDDIINLEKLKNEKSMDGSYKSKLGFRANGAWKRNATRKQSSAATDPNSIQNLRYFRYGPLARRNRARYGFFQRTPVKRAPTTQYLRNRVRYATEFLNRAQQIQRQTPQRPFSNLFIRNRLLALKRLQKIRDLRLKMSSRSDMDDDNFSVIIRNEQAMRRVGRRRGGRNISQLTVRNMQKFDALTGNVVRSRNGSAYSANYRSRRSRSASVGRNSRSGTPVRNYVGSAGEWNSRPGTPANSEASGYSLRDYHSRLLNYGLQRKIAILQGKTVPVDSGGHPVIICNGLGVDFTVMPVGTVKTFHERIAIMLQKL